MNGPQSRNARDPQKPFPGCMGHMISMFDLGSGFAGTKLLTEKAHQDGSPIQRNHPNAVKAFKDKPVSALEVSKDAESKRMPPNVVARLMGLDALPIQQWCNEDRVTCEIQSCASEKEYKDVYEIEDKSSRTEKRMALVRKKFLEAKCLATDGKQIRSKEFQDALEVLSSNRDLFLKFLDEPNSLFSKHRQEFETARPLSQPRRITVLKPAKTAESKDDKQVRKQQYPYVEENGPEMNRHRWSSSFTHPKAGSISRPTRIVILKPSPEKLHEMKNMAGRRNFNGDMGPGKAVGSVEVATPEAMESREVVNESSQLMQEILNRSQRDEAVQSSALSNGYVGDESSHNRSENEDGCNISDLDIATPSPHSISSLSHASYPPEPLVIREAKKRLSERWALVASNGISREQRQEPRSSTLGEMLSIPEVKKEEESGGGDQELLPIYETMDGCSGEESPRNLSRSRSVPISSLFCGGTGFKKEVPISLIGSSVLSKSVVKSNNGKLSFKDKISSLFFSKIKKSGREKFILWPLVSSAIQFGSGGSILEMDDSLSVSSYVGHPEEFMQVNSEGNSGMASSTGCYESKQQNSFSKAALSLEKPSTSGKSRVDLDQPSPISVLEPPFKDEATIDVSRLPESSIAYPRALSRAPLIESLARSLQPSLPKATNQSSLLSEEDRFEFVQKLLSSAGLDRKKSKAVLARWHLPDCPLDPMTLDGFRSRREEEVKCRASRSSQKLLFDCVNAALLDIGRNILACAYPWASRTCDVSWKGVPEAPVTEVVWGLVSNWSSGEGEWELGEAEDNCRVVDKMVTFEVAGRGWVDSMWLEVDEFNLEIGAKLLDELVEEALRELTGRFL